jgi:CDP-diacylglycerol---serine O-phosphatidyltransferase
VFGVKDVFTTINLLGGVIAICLCIDGRPYEAGIAVVLGYLLGDTLDGFIARKLGTANEFGAEYDTISDHTAHVIAPAAIVYTVYKDAQLLVSPWDQVLAMGLAASLVVSVSVRHARNIIAPVEFKGVWAGLPRSVLGFIAIGYCNSSFAASAPGGWWLGVVLIPAMAIATLSYFPFPSHRMSRSHHLHVKILIFLFIASTSYAMLLRRELLFDVFTFWMTGYALTGWLSMTREERTHFWGVVREAKSRTS